MNTQIMQIFGLILISLYKYVRVHIPTGYTLQSLLRTSDSLNERLPIKTAREKFQRKQYFSMKMIVVATLKLSAKVFFS